MAKSRQTVVKKSDLKIGQPKISTFFKRKPLVANQGPTLLKYTQIRPGSKIVFESPECALEGRFGKGASEGDDIDIIPDTPEQHRTTRRLFTDTNSRAPCHSPECDVIPPTPPRPGSQNKPGVSLAYKRLKNKCAFGSIQRKDLFPIHLPSDECEVIPPTPPRPGSQNKPGVSLAYKRLKNKCAFGSIQQKDPFPIHLPSDECSQATKPSCNPKSDQGFLQTNVSCDGDLPANCLNVTPKRNVNKTVDTEARAAKRPKLAQSCIENIPPTCHMPAPALETRGKPFAENLNVVERPQLNDAAEGDSSSFILFDDDEFWGEFADCSESVNATSKENIGDDKNSASEFVAEAVVDVNNSFHSKLPIQKYNRHVVRQVIRDNPAETVMTVSPPDCDTIIRTCILRGFWADTQAREGDIVNVLGDFDDNGTLVMGGDQKGNLFVVNPDFLVSSTTVVSGVFCRRKAVLQEWFRAVEPRNIHMLVGVLVHQLFQEAAERRLTSPQEVRRLLADITSRMNNLQEMYGFQGDQEYGRLHSDLESFVKPVWDWIRRHVVGNGQPAATGAGSGRDCKQAKVDVKQICDIEENVWCPRLGLKGKLDMVVQTSRSGASDSIVPLELKTGRPTFSAEHEGQVTLYRMMGRDRRPKEVEGDGLLLYLRTAECREVRHKEQAQQQLIQMRNEITWHLSKPIADSASLDGLSLAPLPEPLNSQRVCSSCPMLTVCSLFRSREDAACRGGEFAAVYRSAVEHLTQEEPQQSCSEYFFKWCINVFTEDLCTKSTLQRKDIWCETSRRREERGECFSGMILKSFGENGQGNVHRFERCASHRNGESLAAVGLERMQSVVVSVEKRHLLALGTGNITDVQKHYVDVVLDRDLYYKGEYENDVFRIDAYNPQVYSVTALSNLARLMNNTAASERLRSIIIGHEPLKEKLQLTRIMGKKAKPFFDDLNRQQKIAVLMSLATNDYMLIEGTPGSGKTKTIVAIIRMLLHMRCTILLASHTHSAVDNVLLNLKGKGVENFVRLGKTERVHSELVDHTSECLLKGVDSLEKMNAVFNSKPLVATTCLGSNHAVFQYRHEFDYCIIDEATQILQPACLGPLFLCKRFILVGDPQQLPPIVRSPTAKKDGMDESLFALLKSKEGPKGGRPSLVGSRLQLLSEQYRMNEEIMRFSNALSYDGKLGCGDGNRLAVLNLPKLAEVGQLHIGNSFLTHVASARVEESVLLLNTDQLQALKERDTQGKICSRIEAMITLEIVAFFLECGLNASQVGVISPYRNQVALIKKCLAQKKSEAPEQFANMSDVEVNTIDQYQGREKDAVIISFAGRAKAGSGQSDQEILSDKRRINVAITRAKTKLVMIGSREILRFYEPLEEMLNMMHGEQVINLTCECISALHWPLTTEEASF